VYLSFISSTFVYNLVMKNRLRQTCVKCKALGDTSQMQSYPYELRCCNCAYTYEIKSEVEYVIKNPAVIYDEFDKIKSVFKRNPALYQLIGTFLGPLLPNFQFKVKKTIQNLIRNKDTIGINLGSGTSSFGDSVINVDFSAFQNVDIVANILDLPFEDNCFDFVVLTEVIEHIESPELLVSEIIRILKKDGYLVFTSPFMIGFHASPNDFQRYTVSGLRKLFSDFEIIEIQSFGPTGSLLWIFQEWCALWFSFGNRKIHTFLVILFMILTSPLKIFDFLLSQNSNSSSIASTYFMLAKKV
jgi:SAM-dependent methyltransferase